MTKNIKSWFVFLCTLLMSIFITGLSVTYHRQKPMYILGTYNGFAAVFRYGEEQPEQILDTRISALPQSIAEELRRGIKAATEENLQRLVEDYCS